MKQRNDGLVWLAVTGLLLLVVILFVSGSNNEVFGPDLILRLAGLSIFFVSLTICVAIAVLCIRVLPTNSTNAPAYGPSLLTATISLFGILITGVFVITVFRIDTGVREIATEAVENRLRDDLPETVAKRLDEIVPEAIAKRLDDVMPDTVRRQVAVSAPRIIDGVITDLVPDITTELANRLSNDAVAEAIVRSESVRRAERRVPSSVLDIIIQEPDQVSISGDGESSWRRFRVPADGTYAIRAEGIGGFDPFIYVYELLNDDALVLLDVNDDSSSRSLDARVDIDLGGNGKYYIYVEGFAGAIGECVVTIEPVPSVL